MLAEGEDEAPGGALAPAMTGAEVDLLRAVAAGHRRGLEFGCGGSTRVLLAAGLEHLTSVDSDPAWLARVAGEAECAAAEAAGRLRLWHGDVGPVGAWGWPADAGQAARWPGYWRDPWGVAGAVDLVLVDGRFRVAAALAALGRMAPGGAVLVHDFWPRAAYREPLLRHYAVTLSAGTLVALAPRAGLDAAAVAADLARHGLDPR